MDYFHRFQLKPPFFIDIFISLKIKSYRHEKYHNDSFW